MEKQYVKLGGRIPAVLWGRPAKRGVIAVHGSHSHKEDAPIVLLAETAAEKGLQVLSFDLPEHGGRKAEKTLCKPQNCAEDFALAMAFAKERWTETGLFANSLGAYFSLLFYAAEPLLGAWFLSPVADMRRLIEDMMSWFGITEERLEQAGEIPTPAGQTLYWDYYRYACENPVSQWHVPTQILAGGRDDVCAPETVRIFAERFGCSLRVLPDAPHYFHTPEEMRALREWLAETVGE